MARPKRTELEIARDAAAVWAASQDQAQQVGYVAKVFAQTSLPYKEPSPDTKVWGRRNGDVLLTITPGMTLGPNNEQISIGFPYGAMPRLLLAWLSTRAVLTQSPDIELGESLTKFLAELGQKATGGKNGTITRLREQARRLFSATLTVRLEGNTNRDAGGNLLVASTWDLNWHNTSDQQPSLLKSRIQLTPDFFNQIIRYPVPFDLAVMRALRGSPVAMDLYTWLTYKFYSLDHPITVPWHAFQDQLGFQLDEGPKGAHQLKTSVMSHLRKVKAVYPQANFEPTKAGLLLKPSPTSVPPRGMRSLRSISD